MLHYQEKSITYINLDFVRGVSALLVLFAHARAYVMVSASELESPGIVAKLFYFVTGFGHPAVMIFFVLSGFFISRSIVNMLNRDQWTWRRYLVSRMSRLWVVLVPCLVLTAFWDHLGILFGAGSFYEGIDVLQYGSIPGGGEGGVDLSLPTFIGNILFLVGVTDTTVYGSNGPLWSLTYEFWYYMIFPLVFLVFLPITGRTAAIIQLALVAFLLWLLPFRLLWMGIIWLYGYLVMVVNHSERVRKVTKTLPYFLVSFVLFGVAMTAARIEFSGSRMVDDLTLGFCFSLFMLALISHDIKSPAFIAVSKFISKISYTLYLVHFSILAFIAAIILDKQQMQFGAGAVILFVGLSVLSVVYAAGVYWCFERNTHIVITRMRRLLRC